MDHPTLLSVRGLRVSFRQPTGTRFVALDAIDLDVPDGETLGIVGESGSGKSLLCRAILRILPPEAHVEAGHVSFQGTDIAQLPERAIRSVRGRGIAMVFQNAVGSLNPARTIGAQVEDVLRLHAGVRGSAAITRSAELLEQVQIADPKRILRSYPAECSGGTCQRVMIALALACHPRLLIADEATSALDVTTQAEILSLLSRFQRERQMALLVVSHDLRVIAQMCRRVVVLQGGSVVEAGDTRSVLDCPTHAHTRALVEASREGLVDVLARHWPSSPP